MFLVDLDSGKIIAGEEPTEPLTANRSKEMLAFPSKSDNYVVVHNHPNSTMPSGEDLTCLLRDWKNCKCCYVVCHNGDVWQYKIDKTKKQMFDKVSDMEYNRDAVMDDKFMAKVLSISEEEYRANRLAEIYGLIIKRM